MEKYEHKALLVAEKHGIIDYEVEGNTMIWKETWYEPNKNVYLSKLNLDTMEEDRKQIV